jgi:hypothetical protein
VIEAKRSVTVAARQLEAHLAANKVPYTTFDWVIALTKEADELIAQGWTAKMVALVLCDEIEERRGAAPSLATVMEYRRRLDEKFGLGIVERLKTLWAFDMTKVRAGSRFSDLYVQGLRENMQKADAAPGAGDFDIADSAGPRVRKAFEQRARRAVSGIAALRRGPDQATTEAAAVPSQPSASPARPAAPSRPAAPAKPTPPPSAGPAKQESMLGEDVPPPGGPVGRHLDRTAEAQEEELVARINRSSKQGNA